MRTQYVEPQPHPAAARVISSPDRRRGALPTARSETWLGRLLLALTPVLVFAAYRGMTAELRSSLRAGESLVAAGEIVFMVVVAGLLYGNVVYQLARLGRFRRRENFEPPSDVELSRIYDASAGELVVLVPSFKEAPEVVRRTLMSAALQDHPRRRVVLLIDDPPRPTDPADRTALLCMRALPAAVQTLLDAAARPFEKERAEFESQAATGRLDRVAQTRAAAALHRKAAGWFRGQERALSEDVSADVLHRELVLRRAAAAHEDAAQRLERTARLGGLTRGELQREFDRLSRRFRVELSSFERKRYVNLSHEPNKAMNLNSYLGLMGGAYREASRTDGVHLERVDGARASLVIPDAEFVITLDADSMLAPEYSLRLIHVMRRPEHARTAVAQTPYSSIPAPFGVLESVAGATTDIQHLVHQGLTHHHATFWVGANALLRKAALEDIAITRRERGHPVRVFIQDRTVIEDTESSIDLVDNGWRLHNELGRLAYSATPPDFGALLIQRRRWANGGLIILPKLLRHLGRRPWRAAKLREGFFRVHYLCSIAAVNAGLLLMLTLPFQTGAKTMLWLVLASLPYFFLYARDLAQIGHRASDVVRVYALNLALIPVNLGGVLKSIEQGVTGRKIPFGRTPKASTRTATPLLYVAAEYGLLALWLTGVVHSVYDKRWTFAVFGLANALLLAFGIWRYVGLRESLSDVRAALRARAMLRERSVERAWALHAVNSAAAPLRGRSERQYGARSSLPHADRRARPGGATGLSSPDAFLRRDGSARERESGEPVR